MSVTISKLLRPEYILLDLKQSKRVEAIREVAIQLEKNPDVTNFTAFYDGLLAREKLESTCLGNDVAFPHARTDHVRGMVLSVGRSTQGVWFENAEQMVKLIFVIGTPKKMVTEYLTAIGALARLLKDPTLRKNLLATTSAEDFHALLTAAEAKLQAG